MPAPRHTIFISYCRRDSSYAVDRLDERLKQAFSADAVFRDVRSIRKGQPFPDYIRASLQEAAVGLVIIGPWWIEAGEDRKDCAGQPRRHEPSDWVRIEVETLLLRTLPSGEPRSTSSGQVIPVIPMFIGGAEMPKADDLPDPLKSLPDPGCHLRKHEDGHRKAGI